jgi:hypothetical protein
MRILQINYTWDLSAEEQAVYSTVESARALVDVPGLNWKIYIRNLETKQAGGIYLFDDAETAAAWAEQARDNLLKLPKLTDLDIRHFDIKEEQSLATGAPIGVSVAAG